MPLAGGDVTEGVVRVGDTVRRPRGAWSSSVAAYLLHLERAGFEEAPRYHGVDERGRDILDFIEGDVPSQPVVEAWAAAPGVLVAVARMLRRLHAAAASFVPADDAFWFGDDLVVELPAGVPPRPGADIVTHFDVTPQNVVFRESEPVGLIDFDLTRPGSRLADGVNTAMWWVPLVPPEDRDPAFARSDAPARLAAFAAAYGLNAGERQAFLQVAVDGATRSWHLMKANAEHRGGGWRRMWDEGVGDRIRRRHAWLLERRGELEEALT